MVALKAFYSAREIAGLGLDGVPSSQNKALDHAVSNGWDSQVLKPEEGGRPARCFRLPQWAMIELCRQDRIERAKARKPKPAPKLNDTRIADARAMIVSEIEAVMGGANCTIHAASKIVREAYQTGEFTVPKWMRAALPDFTERTAARWVKRKVEMGAKGLEDAKRGPRTGSMFDNHPNLMSYCISQLTGRPHLKISTLHEGIMAAGIEPVPSVTYLQQWCAKWRSENARGLMRATNPDAYKSKYKAAFGSMSEDVTRLNERWEIDGTIADVMCLTPDGNKKRYSLTGVIDVFSRRSMVLVSRQPSAVAVGLLLRKAIVAWGLPEVLKADNGKDYTAAYVNRIAVDLEFQISYCTPFSPEQKPHIERFFKTMSRQLFEILPGYVGHDVAERIGIESRRSMGARMGSRDPIIEATMTGGELQGIIDDWISHSYEQNTHKGIKTSPMLKALEGGTVRKINDERVLDLLLAVSPGKDGSRVVRKDGIPVLGRTYIAPELGAYIGDRVHVRFDPDIQGRIIVYTSDRERFICVAEDPTITDMDRQAVAKSAAVEQKREAAVFKSELKAAQAAHSPDRFAADILAAKAERASKVAPFVRPVDVANDDEHFEPAAFRRERSARGRGIAHSQPAEEISPERIAAVQKMLEPEETPNFTYTRDDGSERPAFFDDVQLAQWMSEQPSVHADDAATLLNFIEETPILIKRLELAGLLPFASQATGVDL